MATQAADPAPTTDGSPKAKVFVGNLSFRTRSTGLKETFSEVGNVTNARVVTKGRKSMGYGFVEFSNIEEAKAAVAKFHKYNLDDREINVEVSTSKNQSKPPVRPRTPKTKKEGTGSAPAAPAAASTPAGTTSAGTDAAKKKKTLRKRKGKKSPDGKTGAPAGSDATSPAGPSADGSSPAKNPKRQRTLKPKPTGPRDTSDTTLFVGNLPFNLDDDGLKDLFKEFNPVSANVIKRKFNNTSKGFGFVTFADGASQQAALDAKGKTSIGDRQLQISKAHVPQPADDASASESKAE